MIPNDKYYQLIIYRLVFQLVFLVFVLNERDGKILNSRNLVPYFSSAMTDITN